MSGSDTKPVREAITEAASFHIHCTQILRSDGQLNHSDSQLPDDKSKLISLYRSMVLNRVFDEQAVALQRTGRLGTFASSLGQEAVAVGAAHAMQPEDVFLPTFREQGGQLYRGVDATELLQFWGGDERGSCFATAKNDFPVCIPVASQYPHAVGVALSFKIRKELRVAVVFGGDGSTSKGDFYEALNMAGTWDLPLVFVIDNNQWAISTPRRQQSHARTLAQKALAAGIPGEEVDGNDVIAVHDVISAAIARARAGHGPSLVEAISYRMADHTTADDASRYRDTDKVLEYSKLDPIERLNVFLQREHEWFEEDEQALQQDCSIIVDEAVRRYLELEPAAPTDMFDYLFATLPTALELQRQQLEESVQGAGGTGS